MKTARLPIDVEADHLGTIDLTEGELRDRCGEGETPSPALLSYPGPVLLWPLVLDDGQPVLLLRDLTGWFTFVMALLVVVSEKNEGAAVLRRVVSAAERSSVIFAQMASTAPPSAVEGNGQIGRPLTWQQWLR